MDDRKLWSHRATLRQFLIFDAIAEAGSTGGAARRLRLSQPAISHALTRLERAFDLVLFERTPQGSMLTPAGEILRGRVQRMGDLTRAIVRTTMGPVDDEHVERCVSSITSTQLFCHLAVAEAGSFQAAAGRLGVSAPAVHRAAHDLARLLAADLYHRSGRCAQVTDVGRQLAEGLRLALAEIDQARDDIRAAAGVGASRIRVGVLPLTPGIVVGRAVAELIAVFPDVELRVEEGPYDQLAPQLRDGRIDFVFGAIRPERADTAFRTHALLDDPYVIVARAGHPLTYAGGGDAASLAEQTWLVPPVGSPRRDAIETLLANVPNGPSSVLEISSEAVMIAILLASDCVTLGPRSQLLSSAPMGKLALVRSVDRTAQRSVGFTMRADWLPTHAQQRMLDLIEQSIRAMNPGAW